MHEKDLDRAAALIEQFIRANRDRFVQPRSQEDIAALQHELDQFLADEFLDFNQQTGTYHAGLYWGGPVVLRGIRMLEVPIVVQIERTEVVQALQLTFSWPAKSTEIHDTGWMRAIVHPNEISNLSSFARYFFVPHDLSV